MSLELNQQTEFETSVEATEFMETLQTMLCDPRLMHWVRETDTNYGSNLLPVILQVGEHYDSFLDEMREIN